MTILIFLHFYRLFLLNIHTMFRKLGLFPSSDQSMEPTFFFCPLERDNHGSCLVHETQCFGTWFYFLLQIKV
jgi:hypothetical protein